MSFWFFLVVLVLPADGATECDVKPDAVARIRSERVTGKLAVAELEARRLLACPSLGTDDRLGIQLELAKILDRFGLHNNTRPVVESEEILRQAESEIDADDNPAQAQMALAFAEYHYRAEMAEREFKLATEQARRAESLFRELDDPVGETDAVHRLGLIAMQKRELQEARALFDRSLEISERAPRRPIFLSDYHRHVGLVDMLEGDQAAAIAHFEESLAYRNEARSRDYGLFARTMLGSALIDDGRPAEAKPHLDEAVKAARDLPSPVGELRATFYLAEMHEALGDRDKALRAYQRAYELAERLAVTGMKNAAGDAVDRLISKRRSGQGD